MRIVRLVLAAFIAVTAALPPSAVHAAPGDLDPSFSGDGRTTVGFPQGAAGTSVATQGTELIVAGSSGQEGDRDLALTRMTAKGRIDRTFGRRGRVRIDVFGRDDTLGEIAVLRNGKIVIVGGAQRGADVRIVVVRLKPDGAFDRTFGGDGIVVVDTPGFAVARAVVPLSEGKIAVGGTTGDFERTSMLVLRLRADGRLDRGFSRDGIATAGFASRDVAFTDLARWGTSDALLAVGDVGGVDVAIVSFAPDGTRPKDFGGGDGKTLLDLGPFDNVGSVVMRSLGFFMVTGYTDGGLTGGWDPFVARFNASGHLDLAWGGGDGVVFHDAGVDLEYWFGAVASGKKIVMAGQVDGDAALFRIRGNGAADGGFGTGGFVVVPFPGGDSIFRSVAVASKGRIAAVGTAPATLVYDGIAVARVLGS